MTENPAPAAILFDLDGTLVDSERENVESVVLAVRKLGAEITEAERAFVIGHSWNEIHALVTTNHKLPVSMAALIASAVAATKGNLSDKVAVQKALEKANFKSVRGNFKFGNNHVPIQNFYLQDVVKDAKGDFVLKTVATIVKDSQDIHHAKCPMK